MQSGKNAMESVKESAANVAASAKAGMEKTKATVQEKVDKMKAHNPVEKEMAAEKKHDKIRNAEINKQEAREHNAATKHVATGPGHGTHGTATHSTIGMPGHPVDPHPTPGSTGYQTGGSYI